MIRIFSLPPCTLLIQDNVDSFMKSKDAADRIIHYIRLYSEQPIGKWYSFLIIVRAIYQIVKWFFGYSAGQRAIHDIESQLYHSWKSEVGYVDRNKLRQAAQARLDGWVQDNIAWKEYKPDEIEYRKGQQNNTKIDFKEGIKSFSGSADSLNESKEAADTIQHCLNRYTQQSPADELEFVIMVVKEIWNMAKWLFGYSAWQLAMHAVENHVYRDWNQERHGVDRTMLQGIADQYLRRLIEVGQIAIDEEIQKKMLEKYGMRWYRPLETKPAEKYTTPQKKDPEPWNRETAFDNLLKQHMDPERKLLTSPLRRRQSPVKQED